MRGALGSCTDLAARRVGAHTYDMSDAVVRFAHKRGRPLDLSGAKFNRLTAIRPVSRTKSRMVVWECSCECGAIVEVASAYLKSGDTKSCGCIRFETAAETARKRPRAYKPMIGVRFGRLLVTALEQERPVLWRCKCDCGREHVARGAELRRGATRSCGCLSSELKSKRMTNNVTHGQARRGQQTPTWSSWQAMIRRCNDPLRFGYELYGGRGIRVCERWHDFAAFREDMGDRPLGRSLDRIDVNGNYEPGNCRWSDDETQQANRRNSLPRVARVIDECASSVSSTMTKEEVVEMLERLKKTICG